VTTEEVLAALQSAGYRVTHQRQTVIRTALGYGRHFTAAEIERDAGQVDLGIGRATLFRTLEAMVSCGSLARVNSGPGRGYIVCGAHDHHHHIICSGCGTVAKVPGCQAEERVAELSESTGFRVDGHYLEYYGLCSECRQAERAKPVEND
jgi:Fur family transcriptional regulator, ferric uptake regulator